MIEIFNSTLPFKLLFLILNIFYLIFLFVVFNRVLITSRIIREVHDVIILKFIAVIKILFAVSLFLLALAIL